MNQFWERARAVDADLDDGLDMVVGDYLELIQPSRDLGQYRLNVKAQCDQSKAMARDLDVLCLMLHQISRLGRDAAEKRKPKHYQMRDLGESSGVERAADVILWAYNDEELTAEREFKLGIAKARGGKRLTYGFHAHANFERALIAPTVGDE